MKKVYFPFCVIFLLGIFHTTLIFADDYNYLKVVSNSGEQSYKLSTLQKITFSNGEMHTVSSDGTADFTLTDLTKLYFSNDATGTSFVPDEGIKLLFSNVSNILRVEGATGEKLQIYHISGYLAKNISISSDIESISLSDLSSGVYIVKVNNSVIKILKQ